MDTLFTSLKGFLSEPFAKPMNFGRYFALVGITILIVIMWFFIAREVEAGYEKI